SVAMRTFNLTETARRHRFQDRPTAKTGCSSGGKVEYSKRLIQRVKQDARSKRYHRFRRQQSSDKDIPHAIVRRRRLSHLSLPSRRETHRHVSPFAAYRL